MSIKTEQLKTTVESLHNCKAAYVRDEFVNEYFDGALVWQGIVSVFHVDRDDTDTCYAWSSPVEGSDNRKFYAVLKIPPVEKAQDAVRASILDDYRREE